MENFSRGIDMDTRDLLRDELARAKEVGVTKFIVYTAGRQVFNINLITELYFNQFTEPGEILSVLGAILLDNIGHRLAHLAATSFALLRLSRHHYHHCSLPPFSTVTSSSLNPACSPQVTYESCAISFL